MPLSDTTPHAEPEHGPLGVAFFNSEHDTTPKRERLTWDALHNRIGRVRRTSCGASCIGKGCPDRLGPAWSPVRYAPGARRGNPGIERITVLTFDLDCVALDVFEKCKARIEEDGVASAFVPTHSDRPALRSMRLNINPSREVLPQEWAPLRARLIERFAIPADPAAADLARLWFMRSLAEGAEAAPLLVQEGPPLDVDEALRGVQIPDSAPAAHKPADFTRRSGNQWGALLSDLGQGGRDVGLTTVAGILFRELPAEFAYQLLHAVNDARCKPPLPTEQVDKIANSIASREADRRSRS